MCLSCLFFIWVSLEVVFKVMSVDQFFKNKDRLRLGIGFCLETHISSV